MLRRTLKSKLIVATAILAAAAFAGGAYAATQDSGTNPRQALLNDAAKRLNVTPAQLQNALTGAFEDQLNAAVRAGRLTQAQANAIEQRIRNRAGAPLPFLPPAHRFFLRPGPRGVLGAAATYLGLKPAQLLGQLSSGRTLAQIAKAHGKTAAGLNQAIGAAVKARLDKAVAAGRITRAQEQQLLSRLSAKLSTLINRTPRFARPAPLAPWVPPPGGPGPGAGPRGAWPQPGSYVPPGGDTRSAWPHPGFYLPPGGDTRSA
jgi:hypothetical protein